MTMNIFEQIRQFAEDFNQEVLSLPKDLNPEQRREFKKVVEQYFPSLNATSYGVGDDRSLHIIKAANATYTNGTSAGAPAVAEGIGSVDVVNGNTAADVELFKELMVQTSPTVDLRRDEMAKMAESARDTSLDIRGQEHSATMPPGMSMVPENPESGSSSKVISLNDALGIFSDVPPRASTHGDIGTSKQHSPQSNTYARRVFSASVTGERKPVESSNSTLAGSSSHSGLDTILKSRGVSLRSFSRPVGNSEEDVQQATFLHISDVIPVLKKGTSATTDVGAFLRMCDQARVNRQLRKAASTGDMVTSQKRSGEESPMSGHGNNVMRPTITTTGDLHASSSNNSSKVSQPGSRNASKKEFVETWDAFEKGAFPGADGNGGQTISGPHICNTSENALVNNHLLSNIPEVSASPEPVVGDTACLEDQFPSWMYQKPLRNEYLIGQIVELTDCSPPYRNLRGVVCNIIYDEGICYDIVLEDSGATMRIDSNRPDLECVGFDNVNVRGWNVSSNFPATTMMDADVPWLNVTIPESLLRPAGPTDLNADAAPFVPIVNNDSAMITLGLEYLVPETGLETEQRHKYQYLESEFLLNGLDAVRAVLDTQSQEMVPQVVYNHSPDEAFNTETCEMPYGSYDMSYLDIQMDSTQYYSGDTEGGNTGVDIDETTLYAYGNPFSSQAGAVPAASITDAVASESLCATNKSQSASKNVSICQKLPSKDNQNNSDGPKKKTNYDLFNKSPEPIRSPPPIPPPPVPKMQ